MSLPSATICEHQHQQTLCTMYLAHTAHPQFLGLFLGCLAWIFVMITAGLNEWRLWYLDVGDASVITSGVAWVGIWRACFYSHVLAQVENCQSISISAPFAPVEIPVAQVLMMMAVVTGLAANICGAVAMRLVYFSVAARRNMRLVFVLAGMLYLLTSGLCVVPLLWNINSVAKNNTIDFPREFQLPSAPVRQRVGSAIGVGIFAAVLSLISGLLFLSYRYVCRSLRPQEPRDAGEPALGPQTKTSLPENHGRDNPAYLSEAVS